MKLLPVLFAAAFCTNLVHAASLSPAEEAIVAAARRQTPASLQLLEQAVNINSGTMNHAGVRAVGALFRTQFDQLGFATRWDEMPASMRRAGHLVATREGTQGKRLLLIGHLDTVFEPDSPVQLWRRVGDTVYGQGVSDMKGGDVIVIGALRALKDAGLLAGTTISVIYSGDEESAGLPLETARAAMIKLAKQSDVALAFEGTARGPDGKDTATIGRRAFSDWELKVRGKQGHSSGVFGERAGYGAIYEVTRILDAFRRELVEPDLTYNPGFILGGTEVNYDDAQSKGSAFGKTNVIANTALVKGDLRYLSDEQRDRARAKMRAIVANNLPGTGAEIAFRVSYPPMSPTPGNLRLLEQYSQVSDDAGLGPIQAIAPGLRGAGDVQFVAPYIDSLDGLGAAGGGAHSPDESLDITSIERATVRTALMIYRLTHAGK
jgi:glutamate carboxypeptidase